MVLFRLTWNPLPCPWAPGLHLIPGFQSLPELFCRHVRLKAGLPDGPWVHVVGSVLAASILQMCVTDWIQILASASSPGWILNPPVALSPVPPLALSPFALTGLPGRTPDLVNPLPYLGLLMDPVISSCLWHHGRTLKDCARISEGTATTGITLSTRITFPEVAAGSWRHKTKIYKSALIAALITIIISFSVLAKTKPETCGTSLVFPFRRLKVKRVVLKSCSTLPTKCLLSQVIKMDEVPLISFHMMICNCHKP